MPATRAFFALPHSAAQFAAGPPGSSQPGAPAVVGAVQVKM